MLSPEEILSATDENAAALAMTVWCMDQNARMTGANAELVIESLEADNARLRAQIDVLNDRLDTITERVLWLLG